MAEAALITGASSGIGEQIGRELARRGFDVILVARRQELLEKLALEIGDETGRAALVLPCDLSDRDQLNALLDRTDDWLGQGGRTLTVLVNNAGTGVWRDFEEQALDVVQRDIDLNVTAVTTLTHQFIGRARAHGKRSRVLNIGSLAAILPTPRYAVYSSTKAYVKRFTEILAYELRGTNISVTCTCPGGVLTDFVALAGQELKGEVGMMNADEVARLSLDALFAGKVVYVPGLLNKASALGNLALPRTLKLWAVERSMRITVKER